MMRQVRTGDVANGPFDIERQQFELSRRQPEALGVAHRALSVHEQNEAVLAIQELVHLLVNARHVGAESLAKRHRSDLRRGAHRAWCVG
jgi:hypothetical protein